MVREDGALMMKISVSLPEDLVEFVDHRGKNRSKTIVSILQDFRKKKEEAALADAYQEYTEFCKKDD
jgi:metal-responsive CopG/Arc/MetJ family transcriptional regulator